MSERKVLTKYYPPDFDPSAIKRTKKPKDAANKLQTVRLMAPFSMRCSSCGEYIYKGRKFNARKETTDESYYSIKIIRFYLKCTRCSAEITFKTDPKHMDYTCEKGARRNFEPWREAKLNEETEEEMFDRIEREAAEHDPMAELESKALDAKTEMAIADSLDQIRTRNARLERSGKLDDAVPIKDPQTEERERQDREDEEAARRAFQNARPLLEEIIVDEDMADEGEQGQPLEAVEEHRPASPVKAPASPTKQSQIPVPTFAKTKKTKKDFGAALGIKKKPALV